MHSPRCSPSPDIFHVNSRKARVTHSCCCMLQCVHYSMERRDAELISMATGLNDRTRVKEILELASKKPSRRMQLHHAPLVRQRKFVACV